MGYFVFSEWQYVQYMAVHENMAIHVVTRLLGMCFYSTVGVYFTHLFWVELKSCEKILSAEAAIVAKVLLVPSSSLPLSSRGLWEQHREVFGSSDTGKTELALVHWGCPPEFPQKELCAANSSNSVVSHLRIEVACRALAFVSMWLFPHSFKT